jgi:radical SAM superfamily enzyme YgiQ (UPF0313 family)
MKIDWKAREKLNVEHKKRDRELKKILLVMCPFWALTMPPLGLAYLHSYLKAKGHLPHILDINAEMYKESSEEDKQFWQMTNSIIRVTVDYDSSKNIIVEHFDKRINFYRDKVISENIQIIGFSVNLVNLLFSIEMAKRIKEKDPGKIIIFGGPHTNFLTANSPNLGIHIYHPGLVDIVVKGEGEETLDEIMRRIEAGETLDGLPNTILYKDGYYQAFAGEGQVDNLDSLPFPSFDGFPLDKYTNRQLPIMMSRGCVRKCRFCNESFISKKYRYRNAVNVFKEVIFQMHKYKVKIFEFNDSMLNSNLKQLELFCDLVIKYRIQINWGGQAGIRKDMNQELLIKMKKAGCEYIIYGVESFSDKVLQAMNKLYTAEDAIRVLRFTKKAGINPYINIIVGFPGEGEKEFNETVKFLKRFHRYIMGTGSYSVCYISPGSDLQLNPDKYGIVCQGKEGHKKWYSSTGNNTYQLRRKRAKNLLSVLAELKFLFHNIYI